MRESKTENKGKNIAEVSATVLFLICLAGMIALRCTYIHAVEANRYFDAAFVSAGSGITFSGNPGEDLYLLLLHGVLFAFGNKVIAGAILQVVLQVLAAIFSYCALRRLSGGVPAVVALAVWGFIPYISRVFVQLSPSAAIFALSCFAIWLATGIWGWWNRDFSRGNPLAALLSYLCVGIMTGFCCCLDVSGVVVLVFLLWVIFLGRKPGNGGEERPNGFWNHKAFAAVFCLLAGALSFAGFLLLFGYMSGNTLYSMLGMWLQMFLPGNFLMQADGRGPIGVLILLILFFAVVTERLVRNLLCAKKLRKTDAVIEEGSGQAEEEKAEPKEEAEEESKEETKEEVKEEKPKIHYIENPLPVPKKVVRKAIDFDYEIADDDDFDIP